jgi:hypothetical protein
MVLPRVGAGPGNAIQILSKRRPASDMSLDANNNAANGSEWAGGGHGCKMRENFCFVKGDPKQGCHAVYEMALPQAG